MAQQLNLFDARFAPKPARFSARQGATAMAVVLLLSLGGAQGLRWQARQVEAEARELTRQLEPVKALRMALAASAAPEPGAETGAELAQLRELDAGQRRIAAALAAGVAGVREGHADYLEALARRASGALWITGFSISDDGSAIELVGRMTDASVLTDYLRSLNAEPRFKGRPFAQLSLKSMDSAGLPYTEFALLSRPAGSSAAAP